MGKRMIRRASVIAAPLLAAVVALPAASAATHGAAQPAGSWQHGKQSAEFVAADAGQGDLFGYSVAMSANGKIAVIGAPGFKGDKGAVYVFTKSSSGWKQKQELLASDGVRDDEFGLSVAVSANGSEIVASSPDHVQNSGAVYVFAKSGKKWKQQAELTASDSFKGEDFGLSLAVSADGSTIAVGGPAEDTQKGTPPGTGYIFSDAGGSWAQTARLTPSDSADSDWFGAAVALSSDGSTAVIGAPGHASDTGTAYVFTGSGGTWQQAAELSASDGARGDEFGASVAVAATDTLATVGAPDHSTFEGAAYVFAASGGTWSQSAEVNSSTGTPDRFGAAVALSAKANVLVVGAPFGAGAEGVSDVFGLESGTWTQQAAFTGSDAAPGDLSGSAVCLQPKGAELLVGAYAHNNQAGSAYLYAR